MDTDKAIQIILVTLLIFLSAECAVWSTFLLGTWIHAIVWGLVTILVLAAIRILDMSLPSEGLIVFVAFIMTAIAKEILDLGTTGFSIPDIIAGLSGAALVFGAWVAIKEIIFVSKIEKMGEVA